MSAPVDQVDTSNDAIDELCKEVQSESVLVMLRALQDERNALVDEVTSLLMDPEGFRAPITVADLIAAIEKVRAEDEEEAGNNYFEQWSATPTRYVLDMEIDLVQVVQHLNEAALPSPPA